MRISRVAAVLVVRSGDGPVLTFVGRLGHPGRRGRAGDVGDRRDVIPVDPVADAEQETGQEDAEVGRGGGGGHGCGDEVEHHGVLVRGAGSVPDEGRYRNALHLSVLASAHLSFRTMATIGSHESAMYVSWTDVRDLLRARGLRWTPQRRTLIDVLANTDGHVTGAELVERCRAHRPDDDPVDRLPHPGRPRGARAAQPQPRRRRARGVPRPARRRPRAPPLQRVRDDLGDRLGRSGLARGDARPATRFRGGPQPPVHRGTVCRLRQRDRRLTIGQVAVSRPTGRP